MRIERQAAENRTSPIEQDPQQLRNRWLRQLEEAQLALLKGDISPNSGQSHSKAQSGHQAAGAARRPQPLADATARAPSSQLAASLAPIAANAKADLADNLQSGMEQTAGNQAHAPASQSAQPRSVADDGLRMNAVGHNPVAAAPAVTAGLAAVTPATHVKNKPNDPAIQDPAAFSAQVLAGLAGSATAATTQPDTIPQIAQATKATALLGTLGRFNPAASTTPDSAEITAHTVQDAATTETEEWAAQHMHVVDQDDVLQVFIRDTKLSESSEQRLIQRLASELATTGKTLSTVTINGREIFDIKGASSRDNGRKRSFGDTGDDRGATTDLTYSPLQHYPTGA